MGRMHGMFHGCGSFQREHVTTWLLPNEQSVAALFDRSDHEWRGESTDDEVDGE
jgi:hypothetical protein